MSIIIVSVQDRRPTNRQNFEKECSVRFANALKFWFGKRRRNPNFEFWKKMFEGAKL